jgi:hypothetical protein
MKEDASDSSASIGRLPKGTMVTIQGERQGNYIPILVELEDGGKLEGWIPADALESSEGEVDDGSPHKSKRLRPKRIQIPEDEKLLLKRERSFMYGIFGGGTMAFITSVVTQPVYSGFGFVGGGEVGLFVGDNLPIRVELGISQYNGTASQDPLNLNFGFNFLDLNVVPTYYLGSFEGFLGLGYSFGLGVNQIPSQIQLVSARDLSTLSGQGGVGYHFSIGYQSDLLVRLRYQALFARSPFVFQAVCLIVALEFQG